MKPIKPIITKRKFILMRYDAMGLDPETELAKFRLRLVRAGCDMAAFEKWLDTEMQAKDYIDVMNVDAADYETRDAAKKSIADGWAKRNANN